MPSYPDALIRAVFERTRTIAVVGLSPNPGRPSHGVARFLQSRRFRIIPVNPREAGGTILGEAVWPDLGALPAALGDVEMVDIFRRSEEAGAAVDAGLAHLAGRGLATVWMQLGVVDAAAAARAEAAGVTAIMDRCPAIEIPRLFPPQTRFG
jgi:predicted CoA-binding protein